MKKLFAAAVAIALVGCGSSDRTQELNHEGIAR